MPFSDVFKISPCDILVIYVPIYMSQKKIQPWKRWR